MTMSKESAICNILALGKTGSIAVVRHAVRMGFGCCTMSNVATQSGMRMKGGSGVTIVAENGACLSKRSSHTKLISSAHVAMFRSKRKGLPRSWKRLVAWLM